MHHFDDEFPPKKHCLLLVFNFRQVIDKTKPPLRQIVVIMQTNDGHGARGLSTEYPPHNVGFFKNQKNLKILKSGVKSLSKVLPASAQTIHTNIILGWQTRTSCSDVYITSSKTINRILTDDKTALSIENHQIGVLLSCGDYARNLLEPNNSQALNDTEEADRVKIKELVGLLDLYIANAPNTNSTNDTTKEKTSTFDLILRLFDLKSLSTKEATQHTERQFFNKESSNNQTHFLAYRFGSTPETIIKSFVAIIKPDGSTPLCRFGNFYTTPRGRKKKTRGIVIPFEKTSVFIGPVDDGDSLEVIIFKKERYAHDQYDGLYITISDEGEPIAGRILLVRTPHKNDSDTNAGAIKLENLSLDELGFIDRIRNRIQYDADSKLLKNDKKVSYHSIIDEVANLFELHSDSPQLKNLSNEAFNPANPRDLFYQYALSLPKSNGQN